MLVHNLTGLRELYLDGVNITSFDERKKWSHIISSHLPNLTSLSLVGCDLYGPLSESFWQLHSLSILRLQYNDLSSETVPNFFTNFPNLTTLNLASCSLQGSLPSTFANSTELIRLNLVSNFLTGSLSSTLFEGLSNLAHLNLRDNSFYGNIHPSLFDLPSLLELDLSYNQFNGTLRLDNFRSLANLTFLSLSHNSLSVDVGNVNSSSYGCLQLKVLHLASCNLSKFPDFIKHLDMKELALSNNMIAGEIPSWIWGTQLVFLDLSFNLLTDFQKPCHIPTSLEFLDLRSNRLRGELQLLIPLESKLWYMYLANNSLSASIPISLCNATYLYALDLSYNRLSGSIPSCLLEIIWLLDLSRNNINGSIPDNFPVDCKLQYFDLNNNTLLGEIPKSLERCRSLEFMNVGNNNIKDTFPCMLSSSMRVLVMHSNSFYGEVRCRKTRNSWTDLQVLDISLNHFGGSLESIDFSSWTAMVQQSEQLRHMILRSNEKFWEAQSLSVTLIMKGMNLELHKIWPNCGSIDCSSNEFYGEIPNAIGDLTSLYHLNFSHNALNGSIPRSFGQLKNLESLDLSVNQLVGLIPEELGGLTFLSKLNLSYNKFVGAIPKGRQIQTFSADSFEGNSRLCGFPLDINCSNTNVSPPGYDENGEEKREIEWEYVCAAVGYVVGAGSIVWLLLFCRSFREKYFGKIEEVVEDMFVARDMRRMRARILATRQC